MRALRSRPIDDPSRSSRTSPGFATDVFLSDTRRFADGKALASYVGIIPGEYSSGIRQRLGGPGRRRPGAFVPVAAGQLGRPADVLVQFGALIGIFSIGSFVVHNHVNLNIGLRLTIQQAVAYFLEWVVVGVVIGLIYRPAH